MCKCDFCGKDYKDKRPKYGKEYGLVRMDNSGDLFVEVNLCDDCRGHLIRYIKGREFSEKIKAIGLAKAGPFVFNS